MLQRPSSLDSEAVTPPQGGSTTSWAILDLDGAKCRRVRSSPEPARAAYDRGVRPTRPRLLFVLVLTACSSSAGEPACPEGMLLVAGGTFSLGEGEDHEHQPNQYNAVIRRASVEVADFCVDIFPFPGQSGAPWPSDGLGRDSAERLDRALADHGRRLCSVAELLVAGAGPNNWRYPYDPESHRPGVCDPDDTHPQPLGTFSECASPSGIRDLQVRSTWARLNQPMREHLEAYGAPNRPPHLGGGVPPDLAYAVWGGTARIDTFYSPNNFGIHAHDADEGSYFDDSTRVCRDPGRVSARTERAYGHFVEGFGTLNSYAEFLEGTR